MIRAALLTLALAHPAHAATHSFCWIGTEDCRIEGRINYPDATDGIVTGDTVTGFRITGWHAGAYLGDWSLEDRRPEPSFTLRFDTRTLAFPMGGFREDGTYQAWNADGTATDCGDPGVGLNGGNRAQDVCVDGRFIEDSGIAPDTPLAISPGGATPCGPLQMSALPGGRILT